MKEWNPEEILGLSGVYWQTCVLHAGVRLNIFTELSHDRLEAETVAARIGAEPRATTMLLNALTAMGLLLKSDFFYANTPSSALYLSRDSDNYLGHMISHHHHLMESWAHLDQAVQTGKPLRESSRHAEEDRRESFLLGMFNLASQLAPVLVKQIDLSEKKQLLDLGGGPGTYSIYFCRENPHLKAVVYDLPTTRPFAEKTISRAGLTDRISFQDGDFLQDGIKGTFDVAWLSHVLHGEGPEGCARMLRKVVPAMEPGGRILIHDFILNDDMSGPLFPAIFSLNMLLGTESGQSYSQAQIAEMLAREGVKDIRMLPLDLSGPSSVITGTV